MTLAHFRNKVMFDLEGRQYVLQRLLENDIWQLEDIRTGVFSQMPRVDLLKAYSEHRLVFIADGDISAVAEKVKLKLEDLKWLDAEAFEVAKVRLSYVELVKDLPMTKDRIMKKVLPHWKKLQKPESCPSFQTVRRWRKKYLKHNKDITRLVDRKRGNYKDRLPPEVGNAVRDAIEEIYLTPLRRTIQDTLDNAIERIRKENLLRLSSEQLPLPRYNYVRRIIYSMPAIDRDRARLGKIEAERRYRGSGKGAIARAPLQRVQVDHTRADVIIVEDTSGIPCGRPWITVALDQYTRCVLGIYIGFESPSYVTVARCLKHGFMPKASLMTDYPEVKHPWNAHGVPQTVLVDNGPEFHSADLEQACMSLGVDLVYCPTRKPWYKGAVERFLGTLNRGTSHGMPGTTFENIFEKGDYDPKKHAVVTLKTFRTVVMMWVSNYYHQRTHRSLHTSPAVMWDSSILPEDIPVPANPQRLDMVMGRRDNYRLDHTGIVIEELQYNSPELREMRLRYGAVSRVEVSIDDSDLSYISVISPNGRDFLRVPCLTTEYVTPGFTRWQHAMCRRYRNRMKQKALGVAGLAQAKAEIGEILKNDLRGLRRKPKSSFAAARFSDGQPPADPGQLPKSPGGLQAPSRLSPPEPKRPEPEVEPAVEVPAKPAKRFKAVIGDQPALPLEFKP